MKKILALLTVLSVLLLSSCSVLPKAVDNNGSMVIEKYGTEYEASGNDYEATSIGTEYAVLSGTSLKSKLYRVGDLDPSQWLTENADEGSFVLYHASSITLPSLQDMNATKMQITQTESISVAFYSTEDQEIIQKAIAYMTSYTPDQMEMWPRSNESTRYQFKFYSDDWPAFSYTLQVAYCEDGIYIYDRDLRECVFAGDFLSDFFTTETSSS